MLSNFSNAYNHTTLFLKQGVCSSFCSRSNIGISFKATNPTQHNKCHRRRRPPHRFMLHHSINPCYSNVKTTWGAWDCLLTAILCPSTATTTILVTTLPSEVGYWHRFILQLNLKGAYESSSIDPYLNKTPLPPTESREGLETLKPVKQNLLLPCNFPCFLYVVIFFLNLDASLFICIIKNHQ